MLACMPQFSLFMCDGEAVTASINAHRSPAGASDAKRAVRGRDEVTINRGYSQRRSRGCPDQRAQEPRRGGGRGADGARSSGNHLESRVFDRV